VYLDKRELREVEVVQIQVLHRHFEQLDEESGQRKHSELEEIVTTIELLVKRFKDILKSLSDSAPCPPPTPEATRSSTPKDSDVGVEEASFGSLTRLTHGKQVVVLPHDSHAHKEKVPSKTRTTTDDEDLIVVQAIVEDEGSYYSWN